MSRTIFRISLLISGTLLHHLEIPCVFFGCWVVQSSRVHYSPHLTQKRQEPRVWFAGCWFAKCVSQKKIHEAGLRCLVLRWVVAWVKADYFSSLGWCGWCQQSATAPPSLLVPSIAVPSRPSRLSWINRSTDLLSLSLSPLADDEAHAYHHGDASSSIFALNEQIDIDANDAQSASC